ncbi:FHA domain-containing protein [Microseira wollei]|uniref:FHA domain-containing protein n=1 Tax=Microseira wollei NIES-4236 TaxID=2530354 RepID=A0AAV3XCY3_9CYAN|nr:FHA domain-containing protein [Microseira wollei]GET40388.1 hypothetical protein MiSe_51970 [Microseira wollei NIES-4236]
MFTYQCPKGHVSTEPDYCSECGAKIQGISELSSVKNAVAATVPKTAQAIVNCPECGTPHEPDSGNFCEICGYNFTTGARGEVPITPVANINKIDIPTPPSQPLTSNFNSAPTNRQTAVALEIIVTIDPSLRSPESPPAPTNQPPITFKLDRESNLIGRRSEMRGIHPDIPLNFDDAVSHRHALIVRQSDGIFILRDIGSSNGTKLNGVELQPMVDTPIKDGDEFTLGHWTRIKVKVANS